MGVTFSIRLCFSMRKSTLLPYPDGNDKDRGSFHFGHSRNASMIKLRAYHFFFSTLRRFSVSACMIVGERIGNFHIRMMEGRFFSFSP